VREGSDVTVITYGATVYRSDGSGAKKLEEEQGISVEVIDLRSLGPTIGRPISVSIKKTSKVALVVFEGTSITSTLIPCSSSSFFAATIERYTVAP